MKKHWGNWLFIFLLLIGLIIRIVYLNSFPLWIGDEELEFVINAKSIFLTGWSIDKSWSLFNGTIIKNILPPVPYLLLAPIVGLFPFSQFMAKIIPVFVHLGILTLIFLLVKKLIGRKEAFATLVLSIINPWSLFFSRTNFEAPIAVLFYLLSWVTLVYSKGYFVLLAFLPLIIAFYSYTGMKLILLPFIVGIAYHAWKYVYYKKNSTPLLILVVLCVGLFVFQLNSLHTEAIGQRVVELALPNSQSVIDSVNSERRLTLSNSISSVFSNKVTVYTKYLIGKYFEIFSPAVLFFQGEFRSTYSLYTHGYFYYIDILFLCLGFLYLVKKNKAMCVLLLYLLIICAIPAAISTTPTGFVALRAALIFPLLSIIIGNGVSLLFQKRNGRYQIVKLVVVGIYVFSLVNLSYIYFFRYPMYASEAYGFSKKILTSYASLHRKVSSDPIVIFTRSPRNIFEHFIFANNLLHKNTSTTLSTIIYNRIIPLEGVLIVDCASHYVPQLPNVTIIEAGYCEKLLSASLLKENNYLSISQLSDSGSVYKIYNDSLCSARHLKNYLADISFSAITSAYTNRSIFCDTFITDPNLLYR